MKKLSHEELQARQSEILAKSDKVPLIVILNNIRSLYNVGSIFRTADGIGVEKLYLCGITPIPPDTQITKTALGAEKTVAWKFFEKTADAIKQAKEDGYQIVLLEQTHKSVLYQDFVPQGSVCLVLGNEVAGVCDDLVNLADQSIEIEMAGLKNSLNVSVSFGIVGYDLRHKLKALHLPKV
ncbi:MAG TPA: RNA methyltransferase [Candidatus Omnitrophica bacterium]|nr:RNA methyltransferase [Candidatus Omnitrophota bacterium]